MRAVCDGVGTYTQLLLPFSFGFLIVLFAFGAGGLASNASLAHAPSSPRPAIEYHAGSWDESHVFLRAGIFVTESHHASFGVLVWYVDYVASI